MTMIDNGTTTLVVQVFLDDGVTPATGLTAGSFSAKKISKQGAAFADFASFTLTERAYGVYKIACDAADTNANGSLWVHLEGTGLDNVDKEYYVTDPLAKAGATQDNFDTVNDGITTILTDTANILSDTSSINNKVDNLWGAFLIRQDTCQSGSTASTVKLDAGASASDNFYRDVIVVLTAGTGAGQARVITAYTGATRVATIKRDWVTTPDNTTSFKLIAIPSNVAQVLQESLSAHNVAGSTADILLNYVPVIYNNVIAMNTSLVLRAATCQAGSTATTIKLDGAASAIDDTFNGCTVALIGGTGVGQARQIYDYVGATKVATLDSERPWATTPDNTTVFAILPAGMTPGAVADAQLEEQVTDHSGVVGSVAEALDFLVGGVNALGTTSLQLLGLSNGNTVIDNVTNTVDGQTACRIRAFSDDAAVAAATQGGSGEGEIATYEVTATYTSPGQLLLYKARRTSP